MILTSEEFIALWKAADKIRTCATIDERKTILFTCPISRDVWNIMDKVDLMSRWYVVRDHALRHNGALRLDNPGDMARREMRETTLQSLRALFRKADPAIQFEITMLIGFDIDSFKIEY